MTTDPTPPDDANCHPDPPTPWTFADEVALHRAEVNEIEKDCP